MPVLPKTRPTKKLTLPNPAGTEVEVVTSLTIGDIMGIRKDENDFAQEFIKMMPNIITAWNLTDEEGNTLPINAETIAMLPVESMEKLSEHFVEMSNAKKNSIPTTQG